MRRLLTPGWLAFHLLTVVLVAAMLALAGWQLSRAASGNLLSWGYTLQWPVFAGFTVFVWAREVRRARRPPGAGAAGGPTPAAAANAPAPTAGDGPVRATAVTGQELGGRRPVITRRVVAGGYDDSDDPQLAAYNRYLAWLSANPGARPVDYPG